MLNHDKKMVAPCGMNCTYCYVHHKKKKACLGCRVVSGDKPASCIKCKIKACTAERNLEFCYECSDYPCTLIKRLDKSYQTRYQESLIQNMTLIKDKGMTYYLTHEKKRLKCSSCEGYLNVHDKKCSCCGKSK